MADPVRTFSLKFRCAIRGDTPVDYRNVFAVIREAYPLAEFDHISEGEFVSWPPIYSKEDLCGYECEPINPSSALRCESCGGVDTVRLCSYVRSDSGCTERALLCPKCAAKWGAIVVKNEV